MATAEVDVERLRSRMNRIRNRMHGSVDELRHEASALTDWHFYVKRFPMTSLAMAALAGFWLTPGHRVVPRVRLDESSIEKLIERGAIHVDGSSRHRSKWWTLLSGPMLRVGTNLLGNAALVWLGQMTATAPEKGDER